MKDSEKSAGRKSSGQSWFNLFLFTGLIAFFSFGLVIPGVIAFVQQYHAQKSFLPVQGEILSSCVTTSRSSKGRVYYHDRFDYQYEVNGRRYESWRYRYGIKSTDHGEVSALVAAHPAGSSVTVYYDPEIPSEAVLSPQVSDRDVKVQFLFLALSFIFLWLLSGMLRRMDWPWNRTRTVGGAKIKNEGMVTRLRLPRFPDSSVTLIAMVILCLVAEILITLVFPLTPPLVVGAGCFAGVLLTGAAVYLWFIGNEMLGRRDLVFDERLRTLQLPFTYGRRTRPAIPYQKIVRVFTRQKVHPRRGRPTYSYLILFDTGFGAEERLIETNKNRADQLTRWLCQKLGLPAPPTDS